MLRMPAFNIWRVQFDYMHTVDLGVLQHAVPSALAELCNEFFEGPNLEERVRAASASYNSWCVANKVESKTRRITVQWVQGPWPCISQVHCKAAALRRMVEWVMLVCQSASAANPNNMHARWRAAFFVRMYQADAVMRAHGRFLDPTASAALRKCLGEALELYGALAASAAQAHRWKLLPKHHALTHLAYDNAGVNPRWAHCYLDEDMVGKLKRIYIRCHGASASVCNHAGFAPTCDRARLERRRGAGAEATAGLRGLQRYRLAVAIMWKQLRVIKGFGLIPVRRFARKRLRREISLV